MTPATTPAALERIVERLRTADAKLREIADIADAALTGDAEHDYTSLHRIRGIARTAGEKTP